MSEPTPFHWWSALQSRKALVIATVLSACITAIVASLLIRPIYEAQVQFYVVEAAGSGGAGGAAASVLPTGSEATMTSYLALLQSVALRRRVVEGVPDRDAQTLGGFADVSVSKKTTLIVRVLDADPKVAATLANAYPTALERFLGDLEAKRREASLAALRTEQTTAMRQADDAQTALIRFLAARSTSSVQREQDLELGRAQQLQADLSSLQTRVATLDQRIAVTAQQMRDELSMPGRQLQNLHPVLSRLAKELTDLEVELAAARAEFDGDQGLRHPKVRMLQARVNEVRRQLDQELASLGSGAAPPEMLREQLRRDLLDLHRQRVVARTETASRGAELAALRQSMKQDQPTRFEEQRLLQLAESARQQNATVAQRIADLQAQALRNERSIVVLSAAEPADRPRFPSVVWNTVLAAMLGFVAAIYLALISAFSGRVRAASRALPATGSGVS